MEGGNPVANGAVRSISVKLQAEVGNYVQGLQRAKAATGDLVNELSKSEQQRQNFQRLGTGMLVAGAGIAAGIGLATKAAIDWETAWAGVVKTVDGSDEQLAALEGELREMARTLPSTHAEIAGVAEAAGQLGVATEDVSSFTRVMIDMGEATNLTAEEAAFAIARMANVMGTSANDVDRLGATIVDLGNNSATTEADIVEMAQRISGAGATIGLTEDQVVGFAAALSSVGIRAEAGGSAISRAMIEIEGSVREGGESLNTLAQVAGMSADEFTRAYQQDAAGAIATFIAGLSRMEASGEDVFAVLDDLGFSEIRLRDALLRLASSGDLLSDSLDTGAQAWEENIALTEEAERRYETAASRLQVARNELNDFAIDMGATFLPAVADAADALGSFVGFLGDLPDPVNTTVGVVAAVTAALLLLGGTALLTVPRIAATKLALDQLAASGGRTAAAIGTMRSSMRLAGLALGPVAAGILAVELASSGLNKLLFDDLNPQIDAFATGLRRLADDGDLAGEALRIMGGQVGGSSREMDRLLSDAWWDKAAVGVQDFVSKVPGLNDTLTRLAFDLDAPREQIEALDQALATLARESPDQAEAAFERLADEMGLTESQAESLRDKMVQWRGAAEVGAEQAEETADGLDELGGVAQDVAEDVDELREAFDELFGVQMDIDRAQIAYKTGLLELREALNEGATSLSLNSEAGRENRSAVLDQIEAIADLRAANIDNGMSIDDANKKYRNQLDVIEEMLIDRGFEEEAVRNLIDSYRDIPASVSTSVETPGMDAAMRAVRNLKAGIESIPKEWSTRVTVHQASTLPGTGGAGNIAQRHGGIVAAQHGLIASSPTVLFGERGTGLEAFIPREGISSARGLELADTAARWHGGRVVAGDGASVGGPFQWHGQRAAADGPGGAAGGGAFTGELYLDSGELLGIVRGEIRQSQAAHDRELDQMVTQRTGAAR